MSSEDPFGGLFGDPDELRRRMAEFAEQMQGAQKVAWADNAIKLAVDMTVAGVNRMNLQGNADQQAQELLSAFRPLLLAAADDLLERAQAEDKDHREEADPERERADRDLLADRVGGNRGAGG